VWNVHRCPPCAATVRHLRHGTGKRRGA